MIKVILWLPVIFLIAIIYVISSLLLFCYLNCHKIMRFLLRLFIKDLTIISKGTILESIVNNLYYEFENNK